MARVRGAGTTCHLPSANLTPVGAAPDARPNREVLASAAERRAVVSSTGAAERGGSREPGGRRVGASEAAAAAALARASSSDGGISGAKRQQLEERRARDELIGKIQHYYAVARADLPIGLGAASTDALKRHLERAKAMAHSTSRTEQVSRRVMR